VVSLIGHYERIAQYLFREDALRQYPGVASMISLRVKARSPWSLMQACWVMVRHLLTGPELLVGIPRSNSRAIRLLVALFSRVRYFTYSDGLGDSIHRFFMEGARNYVGHVGFPIMSAQPLIHEIPLRESIEPWGDRIQFDDSAPVLVIVKTPKEATFDAGHLTRLYARTITAIARHRPVLLSGGLPGLELPPSLDVRSLGPLMNLHENLPISAAVGLPSTAFLTLAMKLPEKRLRIMRLCCARGYPEVNRRIKSMKLTLERCMGQLLLPSQGPQHLPDRVDPRTNT
jgi:hypothetical protein